jgi:hypothetical protein
VVLDSGWNWGTSDTDYFCVSALLLSRMPDDWEIWTNEKQGNGSHSAQMVLLEEREFYQAVEKI